MPNSVGEKPKRKAMFLGPDALRDLRVTSSRRRTERQAMEEALKLLAEQDAQMDAMQDFVNWAATEWGEPTAEDKARAEKIWADR